MKFLWNVTRVLGGLLVIAIVSFVVQSIRLDSERIKRVELEAENERITSIMDRVVKSSMTTRHTIGDCYIYQGEISLLIAEYYGHQKLNPIDLSVDSLLAVPPKDSFPETHLIIREPLDWWDTSEMTE